jgi:hypothetical protein
VLALHEISSELRVKNLKRVLLKLDFMVDTLATILTRANESGHIRGVVSHLLPWAVTHMRNADDANPV